MPDVDKMMESIDAEKLAASMAGMEMPEMNMADIGGLMGMMGDLTSGKVNEQEMMKKLMSNSMVTGMLQNKELMSVMFDNPMIKELVGDDAEMLEIIKNDPELIMMADKPHKLKKEIERRQKLKDHPELADKKDEVDIEKDAKDFKKEMNKF